MSLGRRVHITTLGCRLNEAESEEWAERFRDAGFRVVDADSPADLVVVNTCAVTQEAVRKSRGVLRRSQRANPGARLIVSGCLATLGDSAVSAETGVDLIVANRDKDRLVEIALATLSLPAMPETAATDAAGALFARGRQRAFIKIQDGCRYSCTFCITTVARGAERSRTHAEIIRAIDRLVEQGIREVVLTGVHLGGYGSDLGSNLVDLVARILGETEIPRLRLGSLEPWDLGDAFWRNFEDPRLMPHLHLPLQSGSDRVLRRMARRCKTAEFASLVEQGRARVPDINLTTDIIVGFPGEDAEDWARTLAFAESMRFGHIHAFAYSPRVGTRAAEMPSRVDGKTQRERLDALRDIGLRMRHAVLREQIGRTVEVLCEGNPDGERRETRFGYTPNYLPVHVAAHEATIDGNALVKVALTGLDSEGRTLIGRPIDPRDQRTGTPG
ncbi:MiaB-like tRNA modifying enzyme [Thiocapsa sp. KS1]|nr:tRNA (N(6)-L-threonylcarbamoyladenosine(37)-C(2))-methylthiotransferase MtaB [Thiocapsa sp. KS1]CRI65643.1 MiaB-like tRNA modifying enzyme [Thiocapsa sp. KS1]